MGIQIDIILTVKCNVLQTVNTQYMVTEREGERESEGRREGGREKERFSFGSVATF